MATFDRHFRIPLERLAFVPRYIIDGEVEGRTDDSEAASSGMLNPLIPELANGSLKRSLDSRFVRLSAKSNETGSISVGLMEKRSMALS